MSDDFIKGLITIPAIGFGWWLSDCAYNYSKRLSARRYLHKERDRFASDWQDELIPEKRKD